MGKQKWSMGPPNSPACNPTFTKIVAAEDREEKNLAKQMISQTSVTKLFGTNRTTRCIWHNNSVANYNAPARKQTNDVCVDPDVPDLHIPPNPPNLYRNCEFATPKLQLHGGIKPQSLSFRIADNNQCRSCLNVNSSYMRPQITSEFAAKPKPLRYAA